MKKDLAAVGNNLSLHALIVVLMVVAAGCIFDDDDSDKKHDTAVNPSGGIGEIAARYYPMQAGSSWDYIVTVTGDDVYRTFEERETCIDATVEDGFYYFSIRKGSSEENTRMMAFEGDTVFFYVDPIFGDAAKRAEKPSAVERIVLGKQERLYYRFDVAPGTRWTVTNNRMTADDLWNGYYTDEQAGDFETIVTTGEYLGQETVSSAGVIYDECKAFRLNVVITMKLTQRDYGGSGDISTETFKETYFETVWFASGIGIVKSVREHEFDSSLNGMYSDRTVRELTAYHVMDHAARGYSVNGKVVDIDGNGVSGVYVAVSGEGPDQTAMTGSDGVFLIDGVQKGDYTLSLNSPGALISPSEARFVIDNHNIAIGVFLCETGRVCYGQPKGKAADYLPFEKNTLWKYEGRDYSEINGWHAPYTVTNYYGGTSTSVLNGKSYHVIDSTESPRYLCFRFQGECIYQTVTRDIDTYFTDDDSPWSRTKAAKTTLASVSEYDEGLVYRFDVAAGTSWAVAYATVTRDSSTVCFNVWARYAGTETIEIPAGTLRDCARFDYVLQTGSLTDTHTGAPDMYRYNGALTTITSSWFAPGVGLVKETKMDFDEYERCSTPTDCRMEKGTFIPHHEWYLTSKTYSDTYFKSPAG